MAAKLCHFRSMTKKNLTICVDEDISRRLEAVSADTRLSRGHLVREALRWFLDPGDPLARALAGNANGPWLNRNGQGIDGAP
jgi:hypothetical protein